MFVIMYKNGYTIYIVRGDDVFTEHLIKEKLGSINLPEKFIAKIQHDLDYILSCELEDLQQIILFGSCARGTVKATSDVDWIIVTHSPIEDRAIRHKLLCDICDEYKGVGADLVFTTINQRLERDSSFMKMIESDEIIMWERSEYN